MPMRLFVRQGKRSVSALRGARSFTALAVRPCSTKFISPLAHCIFSTSSLASATRSDRNFSVKTKKAKRSVESLTEADVKGKHVLVRCDFNVPLDKETGEITDDTRIRAAVPTIQLLREKGAKVVLCSHMGRPKGKVVENLRLKVVSDALPAYLGCPVVQAPDCVGEDTARLVDSMENQDVVLLENLRFHGGETKNEAAFSAALLSAAHAEVYVNDAFGCAHRAHSSTAGVADLIQGPAVAGLLMRKELDYLSTAVDCPVRPLASIVGGAKVSTKISVLEALLNKSDKLILGGAMIFTFLKSRGLEVGDSMVEEDSLDLARKLEAKAKEKGVLLYIPEDVVVASKFASDAEHKTVSASEIPEGWVGLDIGSKSVEAIKTHLAECKTVVWNGPMGVFEWEAFANGTHSVAQAMAKATANGCTTIVGGGDSVAAVQKAGLGDQFSHISTGGGASLELLEGLVLPGVAALDTAA